MTAPRLASGRIATVATALRPAFALAVTLAMTACAAKPTSVVDVPPLATVVAGTMEPADAADIATMDAHATSYAEIASAPVAHIPASVDSLRAALAVRDYRGLEALMGDGFVLGLYRSEAMTLDPIAARTALETQYLPPADHEVVATDDRNAFPAIDPPLETMFDPALIVSQLMFSHGWGADGRGEAVLVLAERADGTVYWHGMVLAPEGFGGTAGGAAAAGAAGNTVHGIGFALDAPAGWFVVDGDNGLILTSYLNRAGHVVLAPGSTKIDVLPLVADPVPATLAEAVAHVARDVESESYALDAAPTPFRTASGLSGMRVGPDLAVIDLDGTFITARCLGRFCDGVAGFFDAVVASVRAE